MPDSKKIRILAVDDDELNLEIIEHTLSKQGFDVECVTDGGKALVMLNSSPEDYDIVLLDRMMPVMDGMETLRNIKDNPKLKDINIIMQTAASNKEQVEEGMKSGVYYYLTKPYNKKTLLKIVEAAANNVRKQYRKNKVDLVQNVDECYFEIKTLEEAELTALYVANLFPHPDETLFGIQELLINAIEHGNLGIDFDEKTELNKRGEWKEEVERRLKLPENSEKKVSIFYKNNGEFIELVIKDDGKGFDWKKYTQIDPSRNIDQFGRGISIISLKCFDELNYVGTGNEVHCKVYLKEKPEDPKETRKEESNSKPDNW